MVIIKIIIQNHHAKRKITLIINTLIINLKKINLNTPQHLHQILLKVLSYNHLILFYFIYYLISFIFVVVEILAPPSSVREELLRSNDDIDEGEGDIAFSKLVETTTKSTEPGIELNIIIHLKFYFMLINYLFNYFNK